LRFVTPLIPCVFLARRKRFFVDVRLADGSELTVHCPNSGSMKGCLEPEAPAWISDSGNPKRALRHTLELMRVGGAHLLLNTQRPNALAEEAIRAGRLLSGAPDIQREVRYGSENSRVDLHLSGPSGQVFVEVKNVTMGTPDGLCRFPDAVTERGTKHLRELMGVVAAGHRAVLLFCVSRDDAQRVQPADDIDPVYGQALRAAAAAGVEIMAWRLAITPEEVRFDRPVPVELP
jgi:sugar fermentation stimulation protein A